MDASQKKDRNPARVPSSIRMEWKCKYSILGGVMRDNIGLRVYKVQTP